MISEMENVTPKIYVACLASYNSGILHGTWIYCAGKDSDDLKAEVSEMLDKSPEQGAEEYAIHDHEGFYGLIGEYTPLDQVVELAEALNAYPDAPPALTWLVYDKDYRIPDALDRWREVCLFSGTPREYAETYIDDCYGQELKQLGTLALYIDYEALSRDMLLGGDIATVELDDGEGWKQYVITNANDF